MRRRNLRLLALLAVLACDAPGHRSARIEIERAPGPVPWTHLEVQDGPERFHFVVMTDRTGARRPGVFPLGVETVNLLQPALVMSVGDAIEGYTEDEEVLDGQWDDFEAFVRELDAPYFFTAGNHDMGNRTMLRKWSERFGRSYYHFVYKDVLFVVLNSELFPGAAVEGPDVGRPEEQAQQLAWVEEVLARHPAPRWTFVFLHQPFWEPDAYAEANADWLRVDALLKGRPHTVFAGHLHRYALTREHGHDRITLATTGGGSALRGVEYGEFDHVAWVTMTEEGPVVANVKLDGVLPRRLFVKETAALRERLRSAVAPEPLPATGDAFRGGVQRFTLSNPMQRTIQLHGRIEASHQVRPGIAEVRRVLEPGRSETLEVLLEVEGPVPWEELAPLRATWSLRLEREGQVPYRTTRETAIVPEPEWAVPEVTQPVSVDGRLDEWGRLRLSGEHPAQLQGDGHYGGPADLSLRFDVRRDAEFVYLAVEVTDDSLDLDPDLVPYNQDGVMLAVDARPEPQRSENTSFKKAVAHGFFQAGIFTAVSPPARPGGRRIAMMDEAWPPGTRADAARTAGGYAVELAIPLGFLGHAQGGEWQALRLNLGVTDSDGHGDRTTLWWRPDRFGEHALPGSGRFRRR